MVVALASAMFVSKKLSEGMKAVGAKVKPPISWLSAWSKEKCLAHAKECQLGGTGAYPLNMIKLLLKHLFLRT